jgi:2-(1,2-epoxy-1,2-dihydrophenyl)acetyl-CoA isomerase
VELNALESAMAEPLVLIETTGAVRKLTLNRPAALNSFTSAMHRELRAALDAAADEAAVRCLVITGAGRGFCAGQDLNDPEVGTNVGQVVERIYKPLALRIASMPIPVIAMVNGVAAGAGANFALGCDMVIAAKSASFIQAFSKIGLIPDCGGTWLLPRLVGRAKAIGLAMTGDKLSAEAAERMGLIWAAVDDAALQDQTMALASKLAAMPVKALAATRRTVDEAIMVDYASALSLEARVQNEMGAQPDFREGVAAFLEKRAARFSDR